MPRRLCDSAISCVLPPYNLRWSVAATRFPHSRCERWSVCLRVDRGPIVRSIQRDVDSMNLRSSIAVTAAMLVAHPTAAQDHRFEADPVASVRENFVTCEVLSQLQRVMDDPRFLLTGECEPLSAGRRVRIYARRGPYVCIYPEDTITPCKWTHEKVLSK